MQFNHSGVAFATESLIRRTYLIHSTNSIRKSPKTLHCDQAAGGQVSAPKQELVSLQRAVRDHFASNIHCVDLDNIFGQVDTYSDYLVHRVSPSAWGLRKTFQHTNHGTNRPLPGSGKSLRLHIGADAESGLAHSHRVCSVRSLSGCTAGRWVRTLLHGPKTYGRKRGSS